MPRQGQRFCHICENLLIAGKNLFGALDATLLMHLLFARVVEPAPFFKVFICVVRVIRGQKE